MEGNILEDFTGQIKRDGKRVRDPGLNPLKNIPGSAIISQMPTILEKVNKLIDVFKQPGRCAVVLHNNPDPDSISSGMGLKHILKQTTGVSCNIFYGGIIGRASNQKLVDEVKLPLKPAVEANWAEYQYTATVDCQPGTGNVALPDAVFPDVVIDHHPLRQGTKKAKYHDVLTNVGACASIVTSYIMNKRLEINPNLATALLYGIKSETQDLGREASRRDAAAYSFLFPKANKKMLSRIEHSRLSKKYFSLLDKTISNISICGVVAVADLGKANSADEVSEMADFILRLNNMTWSFCMGEIDELLYVSVRTTDEKKDAGKIIRKLIKGIGTGGGHGMMAGAQVPFKAPSDKLKSRLLTKFVKILGINCEPKNLLTAYEEPSEPTIT